jgi:TolB-like protein
MEGAGLAGLNLSGWKSGNRIRQGVDVMALASGLSFSSQDVRTQMDRILLSPAFASSQSLCRLLRFSVEKKLNGEEREIKEYVIGSQVFARGESFDPRLDPIVRVQATKLRARLRGYYDTLGQRDPIVIEFPKGTYVPVFHRRGDPGTGASPAPERQADIALAVLPFRNLTADPDYDHFCDGLTEELIGCMAMAPGFQIVSRTSVFRYKGQSADVRQIAAELNAAWIIEGSVRRSTGEVCLALHITDASSGYLLSSFRFVRDGSDAIALQSALATEACLHARRVLLGPGACPHEQQSEEVTH